MSFGLGELKSMQNNQVGKELFELSSLRLIIDKYNAIRVVLAFTIKFQKNHHKVLMRFDIFSYRSFLLARAIKCNIPCLGAISFA